LGKVRPEQVKKIAKELITRFPDRFTTNFEENKKAVEQVARVYSSRMRNRIAGYVTRLVVISQRAKMEEAEMAEEMPVSDEEEAE
jgi:small subunit ribosomal protein S17e